MRAGRVLIAMLCVAATGCGERAGAPYVDMLVARFDVPECAATEFVWSRGERIENGHRVLREYIADVDCMRSMERALKAMDFEEERPGTFVARRERDWIETVSVGRRFDHTRTNIRWEEINP